MPAPKQNQFGRIPGQAPANGQLQIRVNTTEKKNWKAAADKSGARSLAQWTIDTLNTRAKKTLR